MFNINQIKGTISLLQMDDEKNQSLLVGVLPFDVRIPRYNRETEAAMQEARDIASGKVEAKIYHSAAELFEELDAE